jgi:hypothetical protein
MFAGMVTFVKFATKLMVMRSRFCMSIYRADSDRGRDFGRIDRRGYVFHDVGGMMQWPGQLLGLC